MGGGERAWYTLFVHAPNRWTEFGFYHKLPSHDYVKVLALHFEKDVRMLYGV